MHDHDQTESRTAAEPEQTLKALRESEARYRNLLEAAPDGVFVTRKDCIVYINPMGLQLLGASRAEQFLGRSPYDIIHPESRKQVRQRIRALLEGTKYTAPIQEKFLRLNGSPLDVEVSATPITDEGEPAILVFFRDVTERKRAEDALRTSEERFRLLVEQAADGIFVSDAEGRYLDVNSAGCAMLGYSRDELLRMAIADIIAPEEVPRLPPEETRAQRGRVVRSEWRFRRKDGSFFHGEILSRQLPDGRLQAILRDITERKQAEETLRAREAQLRLITDNLPVLIAYIDAEQRYRFNNRGYEEWFGRSAAELSGRHLEEVLGTAAYSAIEPNVRKVLGGEFAHFEEEVNFAPPAGKRMIDLSYVPDRAEDGRVRGFFALIIDVTERKATEHALAENEQRLKLAIDVAGMSAWDVDLQNGRILFSKNNFHQLGFVSGHASMANELWMSMIHPQDRHRVLDAWEKAQRERSEFKVEHRIVRPDNGQTAWLRAFGRFIYDENGETRRSIGVVYDITEQKRAELELIERRAEMEQLLQLHVASQTAAAIAHELNQPLNAIASYNEAALRMLQAGNPKPDRLIHAIESSVQQTQRVGLALRQLLEFLHKGETITEAVDLNQAVHEALDTLEADGYDGFQRVLELAPDLPRVQANEVQVQRVLINLLRNGVEAMRGAGVPTGPITVTVRTSADANMAHVTVRDSGPGLSPEAARRIFEPFFTTKPEGIGMGLAISRALIEAHGGSLWVGKEMGSGASFHFTLPFAS